MRMYFEIAAGKYEGQAEKNYKYIDSAHTIEKAIAKWHLCEGYDFIEMDLIVDVDGALSRIPIFGGEDKEAMLRMSIADAWMKVTDHSFARLDMPWEKQLDEVVKISEFRRTRIKMLKQRVKELEAMPNHTPWQAVHLGFMRGELNWIESFDALMGQCGMPMEEALKCLAEHFDRRPVIQETEVCNG